MDGIFSPHQSVYVHPSSYLDGENVIGRDTNIWHFCHISEGARIGEGCTLGQNVFVGEKVVIGNHVKIQNNVSIYAGVELEDFVFCGPSCVFTNVKNPRSAVSRDGDYARTLVRYGATIGANATIVCGVTIGRHAFIGAGAVVTGNVPAHALMLGVPAKQDGWVGWHGERLRQGTCSPWSCPVSGWMYFIGDDGDLWSPHIKAMEDVR